MDPLARLGRKDKWFLGGGKGALYAPPFPKHLLAPGFWDECYLADIRLPRLFTALFVGADGQPIRFESYHKGWRPDRLTIMHYSGDVVIRERRCVTEGNAWVTELELVTAVRPVHVFQWSLQDIRPRAYGTPWSAATDLAVTDDSMRVRFETAWPGELEPDRTAVEQEAIGASGARMLEPLPVFLEFGASHPRQSWTVNLAQRHDESPLYELSVLPEKFRDGRLPEEFKLWVGPQPSEGLAHVVQHYVLDDRRPLTLACGAGLSPETARRALEDAQEDGAIDRSGASWRTFFDEVPAFESSDPWLTSAYWYRWYGLRLNTVDMPDLPVNRGGGEGAQFSPFVTEGIGFFRNFVTYSAQAHLREVSWMHDPSLAMGILDNLGKVQREDGSFPGHNYSARPPRDFYHADFATGLWQLHALHPGTVGREHLQTMRHYADYFLRHRTLSKDPAGPTMYDVFDQNETGQEYMSRYQFANERADEWESFRVSGVDATVYAQMLFETLARFRAGGSPYAAFAEGALMGLAGLGFAEQDEFFCDRSPDGKRSPARPATGLYPLMLPSLERLMGQTECELRAVVEAWLLAETEFWLSKGFPATAKSDPTFRAEGEWKDRRLNCPWNGRSWPMANSHLVDAIANVARIDQWSSRSEAVEPFWVQDEESKSPVAWAGEALMKAIRLMFHDGDPMKPNSYEHYNPETGVPALYRGYDDYMHSWIVDLILRQAVGVRPGEDTVDPLPLDVDWIECRDIPHPRGRMHVRIERGAEAVVEIELI